MLPWAIATSIDAIAAGFTLNLLAINAYLACLIIALTTGVLSMVGVYIGRQLGTWFASVCHTAALSISVFFTSVLVKKMIAIPQANVHDSSIDTKV